MVTLGLGLVGIGRRWGHVPGEVPSETETMALLESAVELGIRYFDTAPSYGTSEERLGRFLDSLGAEQRRGLTLATKFGEHWDAAKQEPFVDHSYDALRRSLDRSLERLGRIDILQLHKTTPAVLASPDVARAWEYALALGIGKIGPSVADAESARIAIANRRFACMQLPFNPQYPVLREALVAAGARGMWVAVNRPYAMGSMLYDRPMLKADAFRFILEVEFEGVILSGTKSRSHLLENWQAFRAASTPPESQPDLAAL
jgi:aryl-alcohol dehydrogenase-like predicted oxidoreductase